MKDRILTKTGIAKKSMKKSAIKKGKVGLTATITKFIDLPQSIEIRGQTCELQVYEDKIAYYRYNVGYDAGYFDIIFGVDSDAEIECSIYNGDMMQEMIAYEDDDYTEDAISWAISKLGKILYENGLE